MTVRMESNKHLRYLTLKRHIKFVWTCANGQRQVAKEWGKLTRDDYRRFKRTNWGKDRKE